MDRNSGECIEPQRFEDLVGQKHLFAKGKPLYLFYHSENSPPSLILYGPPGTGKTSYAKLLAKRHALKYVHLNATTAGIKDLRIAVEEVPVLVVIDEIHRFDIAKQDFLLGYLERGDIVLVGTSTHNPYFKLNKALRSRCFVYQFKQLLPEELKIIAQRAAGCFGIEVTDDALEFLANYGNGDARRIINVIRYAPNGRIDARLARQLFAIDGGFVNQTERHDLISAFIKSMRGSDPDAAIYYLARLLKAGEDPEFIARRICIFASEDIGLADKDALALAYATLGVVKEIGLPECAINLAHCVIYLSLAKKSNSSYIAIKRALSDVEKGLIMDVPDHLKLHPKKPYLYPHNFKGAYVKQSYLQKPVKYFVRKENDMV